MFYDFECQKCGKVFELQFRMGECPSETKCSCGGIAKKKISAPALKIGGVFKSGGTSFGNAVKQMNDAAAKRMKGRDSGVKLQALDYGGGDVREI